LPQISLSYWLPYLALRNVGSASLTLNSISGSFLTHNCGTGLSAGNSCILTMPSTATVTINSNAQPTSQSFSPVKNTLGPSISLDFKPSRLVFPPQQTNTTSAARSVKITNVTQQSISIT